MTIYSTKKLVTHIETNQLTCNASEFTDSYMKQYITKTSFQKRYTFVQFLNVDLLSTASLDIL